MKILVDADGCPVVGIAVDVAKKYNIECVLVCDTSHVFSYENVETITVSKGADSADFKLVNLIKTGDIVITQDYGLAAMALSKKAVCISQNGMVYDEKNIDDLLSIRHISKKVRNSGGRIKGPSKRTKEQDEAFKNTITDKVKK
ncbi:MAG: YaiI/YqxD family protein [Oscillospiraceae bacterium]